MPYSEDRRKHLEMIQAVITRMAGNSFLIRGWTVTLVAALFALAADKANRSFVVIAYFPSIAFWCLDAYYLAQERRFRALYDAAVEDPEASTVRMYSMNLTGSQSGFGPAFWSLTVITFHLSIIVVISIIMWLLP